MFEWLMIALFVATMIQPTKSRTYAAAVFTLGPISHDALFGSLDGSLYFPSGMAWSALIMVLLSGVQPLCNLVIRLQVIFLAFILVDFISLVLWYFYYEPTFSVYASSALYGIALIYMIRWDKSDVYDDSWRDCVRNFTRFWRSHNSKN